MSGRKVVPLTPRPTVTCYRCGARANPGQRDGETCPAGGCGGRLWTPSVVDWGSAGTVTVTPEPEGWRHAVVQRAGLAGFGALPAGWADEDDRRIGARALAELAEAKRAMDEIDGGFAAIDTDEHPERIGEPLAERIRRWAGGTQ